MILPCCLAYALISPFHTIRSQPSKPRRVRRYFATRLPSPRRSKPSTCDKWSGPRITRKRKTRSGHAWKGAPRLASCQIQLRMSVARRRRRRAGSSASGPRLRRTQEARWTKSSERYSTAFSEHEAGPDAYSFVDGRPFRETAR